MVSTWYSYRNRRVCSIINVKTLVKITKGVLYGSEDKIFTSFSKDTRTISKGDVYIGIKGENYDGNNFYQEAFDKGAIGCILNETTCINDYQDKTIILVKDTIKALQDIAKYYLDLKGPKVIAITGSVGKTSTKDMIYDVLKQEYSVLKTEGNYNNHIGLPLTILKLKDENILLLEMGMSNKGEISLLSKIAKPDIAIINNIYPVHIESLGSMENILKAKLEILAGLKENGILVLNNDNEYLRNFNKKGLTIRTYGIHTKSDIRPQEVIYKESSAIIRIDNVQIEIAVPTQGYVSNALAAYTIGELFKIKGSNIKKGLENFKLSAERLEVTKIKGITIINDAYNASGASMKNGLDYLMNIESNRHIAILGDMWELGEYNRDIHQEVGKYTIEKKIDILIAIGRNAKYIYDVAKGKIESYYFKTKEDSYEFINKLIKKGDALIIKASHGMKFTELVDKIKENIYAK